MFSITSVMTSSRPSRIAESIFCLGFAELAEYRLRAMKAQSRRSSVLLGTNLFNSGLIPVSRMEEVVVPGHRVSSSRPLSWGFLEMGSC